MRNLYWIEVGKRTQEQTLANATRSSDEENLSGTNAEVDVCQDGAISHHALEIMHLQIGRHEAWEQACCTKRQLSEIVQIQFPKTSQM